MQGTSLCPVDADTARVGVGLGQPLGTQWPQGSAGWTYRDQTGRSMLTPQGPVPHGPGFPREWTIVPRR